MGYRSDSSDTEVCSAETAWASACRKAIAVLVEESCGGEGRTHPVVSRLSGPTWGAACD